MRCYGVAGNNKWTPTSSIISAEGDLTSCTDGIDNDCDQLIDCNDENCGGTIMGTVQDTSFQPIPSANLEAKKNLITVKSALTNPVGSYSMGVNCGSYNVVASHSNYLPETKSANVPPLQTVTVDFTLTPGSPCESDCTWINDNTIHSECDGINGCTFWDPTARAACNNGQPGWIRSYNETHYIICSNNQPQPKVTVTASTTCSSGTLVKVVRIVIYNGRPVKLVVAACG